MDEPVVKQGKYKVRPRWKKGESGNPNGRPRKEDTMSDCIREYVAGVEFDKENGEKLTRMQILARAMYKKALSGDASMTKELLDRGFGKCKDIVDMNLTNEHPYIAMLQSMREEIRKENEKTD